MRASSAKTRLHELFQLHETEPNIWTISAVPTDLPVGDETAQAGDERGRRGHHHRARRHRARGCHRARARRRGHRGRRRVRDREVVRRR